LNLGFVAISRFADFACRHGEEIAGLAPLAPGMQLNEWIDGDGPTVFLHACKLGLEGIVSKRKDSRYRCDDWLKSKDRHSAGVRREAEEDWGR
jgi:ATP-dependent DNA ligase